MTETRVTHNRGPILVAVDGTEDGDRALRFGVEEARRRSCGLRLVHVPHETIPMAPMLPLFAASTLHEIGALHAAALATLAWAGRLAQLGGWFYLGLAVAALLAIHQQWGIRTREPQSCFRAFLDNNWFGCAVFVGIALDYLFR